MPFPGLSALSGFLSKASSFWKGRVVENRRVLVEEAEAAEAAENFLSSPVSLSPTDLVHGDLLMSTEDGWHVTLRELREEGRVWAGDARIDQRIFAVAGVPRGLDGDKFLDYLYSYKNVFIRRSTGEKFPVLPSQAEELVLRYSTKPSFLSVLREALR